MIIGKDNDCSTDIDASGYQTSSTESAWPVDCVLYSSSITNWTVVSSSHLSKISSRDNAPYAEDLSIHAYEQKMQRNTYYINANIWINALFIYECTARDTTVTNTLPNAKLG